MYTFSFLIEKRNEQGEPTDHYVYNITDCLELSLPIVRALADPDIDIFPPDMREAAAALVVQLEAEMEGAPTTNLEEPNPLEKHDD